MYICGCALFHDLISLLIISTTKITPHVPNLCASLHLLFVFSWEQSTIRVSIFVGGNGMGLPLSESDSCLVVSCPSTLRKSTDLVVPCVCFWFIRMLGDPSVKIDQKFISLGS